MDRTRRGNGSPLAETRKTSFPKHPDRHGKSGSEQREIVSGSRSRAGTGIGRNQNRSIPGGHEVSLSASCFRMDAGRRKTGRLYSDPLCRRTDGQGNGRGRSRLRKLVLTFRQPECSGCLERESTFRRYRALSFGISSEGQMRAS